MSLWALALFGWYLLVVGLVLCLRPEAGRRLADWWLRDKTSRPYALVPGVLGAFIWWVAPETRTPIALRVLAVLAMAKCAYLLLAPRTHLQRLVDVWRGSRPVQLRLWGLVTVAFALVILRAF